MNTIQIIYNVLRVHEFIRREEHGGASLIASRLGVHPRTIFRYMDNFSFNFTVTYARSDDRKR